MEEQIFRLVRDVLVEQFELDRGSIEPQSKLYDDLGIDSIDAVDLLVRLKELTGKQVPPERFRSVRTVGDVVTVIEQL